MGGHIVVAELDPANAERTAAEVRALGRRALVPTTVLNPRFIVLLAIIVLPGCAQEVSSFHPEATPAAQQPLLQSPPLQADPYTWILNLQISDDWILIDTNTNHDAVHFMNKDFYTSDSGNPIIFVRAEEKEAQQSGSLGFRFLSYRMTMEVDCHRHRYRDLEVTLYAGRNLKGQPLPLGTQWSEPWSIAAPDTMGDGDLKAGCALASKKTEH